MKIDIGGFLYFFYKINFCRVLVHIVREFLCQLKKSQQPFPFVSFLKTNERYAIRANHYVTPHLKKQKEKCGTSFTLQPGDLNTE